MNKLFTLIGVVSGVASTAASGGEFSLWLWLYTEVLW